jgi:miniconductance mechanosensitive channel
MGPGLTALGGWVILMGSRKGGDMLDWIEFELQRQGIATILVATAAKAVFIICLAVGVQLLCKGPLLRLLHRLAGALQQDWQAIIVRHGVFRRLAGMPALAVLYTTAPAVLGPYLFAVRIAEAVILVYLIVAAMLIIDAVLDTGLEIYDGYEIARQKPLKGFAQVLKILTYCLGSILVVAAVLDKSPIYLFSGLTALTAILILVFRDAILGFVAGIQLTANKLVSTGDWIEMPKYQADGTVTDVALTTVQIQNWDKTITTVPTHALIGESFKNWRGMADSDGRRIKRSLFIDLNTVKFCDTEMLERFRQIEYIGAYIEAKKDEIRRFNTERAVDDTSLANGRRLTNVGTFRAYIEAYLRDHPMVNQEMTFLVRHLQPGQFGLPIEIYVFCKDKVWANYEAVQADIFDHILAVVPVFDLRVFQRPAGRDFGDGISNGSS